MDQLFVFFCCCCFVFVVFFSVWKTLPSATLCVNDDEEEMKPLGSPRARVAHMIAVPLTYQLIQTCTMQTKAMSRLTFKSTKCAVPHREHKLCTVAFQQINWNWLLVEWCICRLPRELKCVQVTKGTQCVQVTKGTQCVHEQCLLGTLLPSHEPGNKASSIVCAKCLLTCKQY